MVTMYILFAIYTGNGPSHATAEFNSQGACEMALSEGKRNSVFDRGFCSPKG